MLWQWRVLSQIWTTPPTTYRDSKKGNSNDLYHIRGVIRVVNNSKEKAGLKDSTSIELSETTRRLQQDNPVTDLDRS